MCFFDGNNRNSFWASCGKIRPLALNYPMNFVPDQPAAARRCACFLFFYFKLKCVFMIHVESSPQHSVVLAVSFFRSHFLTNLTVSEFSRVRVESPGERVSTISRCCAVDI